MMFNICKWCRYEIEEGEPHDYCDKLLAQEQQVQEETHLAWDEYLRMQDDAWEIEYELDICPCGHTHAEHDNSDGYCLTCAGLPGAKKGRYDTCPRFGTPEEEYYYPTIINVGDGPGGLTICE